MAKKKKTKIVDPKNKLYLFIMDVLAPLMGHKFIVSLIAGCLAMMLLLIRARWSPCLYSLMETSELL